jgi:hypothetical protein
MANPDYLERCQNFMFWPFANCASVRGFPNAPATLAAEALNSYGPVTRTITDLDPADAHKPLIPAE